ncbi:hypothetical protein [Marinomonas transparens]|uniref:Outer membrane protein beta-barrel domain-containing protein n=1 Tax=Marinomonas transparens TaxID=2795388 RepID=A0A934JNP7_9GAMM|nr:hypothetical protein [Marinomonas transparens]MBJ7539595.1 hypothetical protein [Marinomonas transparens]
MTQPLSWLAILSVVGAGQGAFFTLSLFTNKRGSTSELDIGVRKIWTLSSLPISPYIGGGIALVEGSKQTNSTGSYDTQKDSASGTWVGVGAYWDITRFFTLGVDMRLSNAEVKIAGEDMSAGGVNAGITAGLHW